MDAKQDATVICTEGEGHEPHAINWNIIRQWNETYIHTALDASYSVNGIN